MIQITGLTKVYRRDRPPALLDLTFDARRDTDRRFVLGTVLLGDAAVAAVLAHQLPAGALSVPAAVRSVTAVVPLLPLPIAALGAGALGGALVRARGGHEVRHPGLAALRVSYRHRNGLLAGKPAVIGLFAAALAVATTALDAVVLRFALPADVDAGRPFTGDVPRLAAAGTILAVYGVLMVLAGWAGLLATPLVRSAAAGLLILCALPALLEPALVPVLRQPGQPLPDQIRELLPFQYGLDWLGAATEGAAAAPGPAPAPALQPLFPAVLLASAVAFVGVCLLVQAGGAPSD
ncbi:hypothetical protein [Kitasatospora sp. NPDC001175]|uniref:hypothetical protein n=1 Tax=Kitasatospora sp. NPDC001175 TaxID=3157103 RepID=UPI003CFF1901